MNAAIVSAEIPATITAERQWAVRRAKVPYIPGTTTNAKSNDPSTWRTFDQARAAVEAGQGDGLYYALRTGSDIVGLDLDHCVTNGVIDPWAMVYVRLLHSYTCLSASGTGIRILVKATKTFDRCKKGPVECYDHDRFLSITDQRIPGTPDTIEERQAELDAFGALAFPPDPKPAPKVDRTDKTKSTRPIQADDRLAIALRDPKFARLHSGDVSGYPSPSEARMGYLVKAAFYSEKDARLMETWFRASSLNQTKWDEHRGDTTFGANELAEAIDFCSETYSGPPHTWPELQVTAAPGPANGSCSPHCDRHLALIETQKHIIAEQRAELDKLRECERLLSAQAQLTLNDKMNDGDKFRTLAIVAETGWRGRRGDSTPFKMNYGTIAKRIGSSRGSVAKTVDLLNTHGVLKKIKGREYGPMLDRESGQLIDGWHPQIYIEPAIEGDLADLITAAASIDPGKPTPGGKREKRPPAPTCAECGGILACTQCGTLAEAPTLMSQDASLEPATPKQPSVDIVSIGLQDASLERVESVPLSLPLLDLPYDEIPDTEIENVIVLRAERDGRLSRNGQAAPKRCTDCTEALPPGRQYTCTPCSARLVGAAP